MIPLYDRNSILILDLLTILKTYTDKHNRLTQKEIIDILEKEYFVKVERKTVKENMEKLILYGEQNGKELIYYEERTRKITDQKTDEEITVSVYTNFGYRHDFADSELRLIIDSLLFSKRIPNEERKQIIMKLEQLTNKNFTSRVKHITSTSDGFPKNDELFVNIAKLDEAISNNVQVSFNYYDYVVDQNLNLAFESRINNEGNVREYMINPYQMVAADGRYYLICNNDKFDTIANYRVDRIKNVKLRETKRKPIREIIGFERGLDLQKYIDEHIYMFAGESERVTVRLKKYALNEFIEFFNPENIIFSNQTEDEITARV